MKKWIIVTAALVVLLVVGLLIGYIIPGTLPWDEGTVAQKITLEYIQKPNGDVGFTQDVGWVKIGGYYKGGEADVVYRVTNSIPGKTLAVNFAKLFNVDPDIKPELEGRGYQAVPSYYSDWIDVSANGSLEYGETAEYTLVLKIPADAVEEIPDKWVIQTIADIYAGGFTQVAPAVWWTIDMR